MSERPAGVEGFVNHVIVGGTVKRIGARLHRDIEYGARGQAKLGGEVAGLHGDFLDGVYAGLRERVGAHAKTVGGIETLDTDLLGVYRRALQANGVRADVVGAGDHLRYGERIANSAQGADGQLIDALGGDVMAEFTAFGFEKRGGFVDGDRFRGGADFERGVGPNCFEGLQREALADVFFESGDGDADFVGPGRQLADGVAARSGGGGAIDGSRGDIAGFDGSAGDDGARGIGNSSGDAAAIALAEHGERDE